MIETVNTTNALVLAGLLGLASHSLIFIRGEWHLRAVRIFRYAILGALALCAIQPLYFGITLGQAAFHTTMLATTFMLCLFGSILVYRAFFHRLRHFPGPFGAKLSKFWHVFQCRSSQNHLVLDHLYKKYGAFVRTGPCELTIVHPDGLTALHGPRSQCRKAVFYDIMKPEIALNTTRDLGEHRDRRRVWDLAFASRLLSDYRCRILDHAQRLERKLASTAGNEVNATSLFALFGTGIMVDLAFGRGSQDSEQWTSDEEKEWQSNVDHVRNSLSVLGPFGGVAWLLQIGFSLPFVPMVREWLRMKQWARDCVRARLRTQSDKPNISHWLIESYHTHPKYRGRMDWLTADAFLVIVAGSDTTIASLNNICYHLAKDRRVLSKLRRELDATEDLYNFDALHKLPYLNAIIEETLRLHPLVSTGLVRETPPEGITIDETYIPGGVTVVAPAWSISRLEECFEHATEFIPERWLEGSQVRCTTSASKPFNQGRYSCPGRTLALNVLRVMIALIATKYDMNFPVMYDQEKTFKDMKDCFVSIPGELRLIFESRVI